MKAELISWVKTILFAVITAFIITRFIIVNAIVPTGSMENNILIGDRIVANRLAYVFSEPERFDVVVFKYPGDPTEKTLYVKRIIGMPGETLEIIDGRVYINGSDTPLEDLMYVKETPYGNYGPYEIPEGHYFMMGDNRNASSDSREWLYLDRNKMLGKVLFKYYKGMKVIK